MKLIDAQSLKTRAKRFLTTSGLLEPMHNAVYEIVEYLIDAEPAVATPEEKLAGTKDLVMSQEEARRILRGIYSSKWDNHKKEKAIEVINEADSADTFLSKMDYMQALKWLYEYYRK